MAEPVMMVPFAAAARSARSRSGAAGRGGRGGAAGRGRRSAIARAGVVAAEATEQPEAVMTMTASVTATSRSGEFRTAACRGGALGRAGLVVTEMATEAAEETLMAAAVARCGSIAPRRRAAATTIGVAGQSHAQAHGHRQNGQQLLHTNEPPRNGNRSQIRLPAPQGAPQLVALGPGPREGYGGSGIPDGQRLAKP